MQLSASQSYKIWKGYAFENICLQHIDQITQKLELNKLVIGAVGWKSSNKKTSEVTSNAQIDLLLDRSDNTINICEIKYYQDVFSLQKADALNIINKKEVFQKCTKTKKQILVTLIVNKEFKENVWSHDVIDNYLIAEEALFGGG